jgi:predicted enzyme related to lactoylglutathione lyase
MRELSWASEISSGIVSRNFEGTPVLRYTPEMGTWKKRRCSHKPEKPWRFRVDGSSKIGKIAWTDLSVPDAEGLRDFYSQVVGWTADPVSMGEYSDYSMAPPGRGDPVAGICHARGVNADLAPVWLIYIVVQDLEASLKACVQGGGEVLVGPKSMDPGSSYAVIKDPAGAVSALFQVAE